MAHHPIVVLKKEFSASVGPAIKSMGTVNPELILSAVLLACENEPKIITADRASLWNSARKCAADGLVPDGRQAAIVLYGNKAQYMPMVQGVTTKVLRGDIIKSMYAEVLYEGEDEMFRLDLSHGDRRPIFEINHFKRDTSKKIIGAFASAVTAEGAVFTEMMDVNRIEKARMVSGQQKKSPKPIGIWAKWYEEMSKKTVIHALCKILPVASDVSAMLDQSLSGDERPEYDIDAPPLDQEPTRTARDDLEDQLKGQEKKPPKPKKGKEKPKPEVEDAVIIKPDYVEEDVIPGEPEYTRGQTAAANGKTEEDCPYDTNPAFSNWVGGFRAAE